MKAIPFFGVQEVKKFTKIRLNCQAAVPAFFLLFSNEIV
jgi:hypothetical protein